MSIPSLSFLPSLNYSLHIERITSNLSQDFSVEQTGVHVHRSIRQSIYSARQGKKRDGYIKKISVICTKRV